MDKTPGIFLSHLKSERIERHFGRLRRESGDLIEWEFVYNQSKMVKVDIGRQYNSAMLCMPRRYRGMVKNRGVLGGYIDTLIFPIVLALDAQYVWVQEYDVDFSGNWSEFYEQFRDNDADLLTTTIVTKKDVPDWYYWPATQADGSLPDDRMFRAFLPIMRISRRLANLYVAEMNMRNWGGHYEFLVPTIAINNNLKVEDIGGIGPYCPADRKNKNYMNNPYADNVNSGTFVFRPPLPNYFHENHQIFERKNFLYHPIKPDILPWESAPL